MNYIEPFSILGQSVAQLIATIARYPERYGFYETLLKACSEQIL